MPNFTFNDPSIPSLAAMPDLIRNDVLYLDVVREANIALTLKLAKWAAMPEGAKGKPGYKPGVASAEIPFTRQNLKELRSKLKPGALGVTPKTIENAFSIANGIADHFDMPRGYGWAPLSVPAQRLMNILKRREDRGGCNRLLQFMSARDIDPALMSDALTADFRVEIEADWRIVDKPRAFRRALYAWNAAVKTFPEDWPQITLKVPTVRKVWGKRWSYFLPSLESTVDAHFEPRLTGGDLYDKGQGLEKISAHGQKESVRMAACALHLDGVPLDELSDIRAICRPDRYDRAVRLLRLRKGAVNSSIAKYASDLAKLAKYSGVLSKSERKAVTKAAKNWQKRHAHFNKTYEDPDQLLLDNLDDPKVCDALLSLAQRTVKRVRRSKNRFSVGNAYAIQRALVLEVWLCAPIRIKNVLELEFEKHFFELTVDGVTYVALRLKAAETKNKNAEEHFLNQDTAELLQLYIEHYRDIILKTNRATSSPYLFPGMGGEMKCYQTVRNQMGPWIADNTGLAFHPHAIRKIVPKIILDVDPTAIEAAISAGGWKDDRMLRKVYGQRTHRATQKQYIELLESRRLTSLGTMRRRNGER
jgi:hypothetical protein